jgi:hypothetical protein
MTAMQEKTPFFIIGRTDEKPVSEETPEEVPRTPEDEPGKPVVNPNVIRDTIVEGEDEEDEERLDRIDRIIYERDHPRTLH